MNSNKITDNIRFDEMVQYLKQYYQPIVSLSDGTIVYDEVLLRKTDSCPYDHFEAMAEWEKSGEIIKLDLWNIQMAMENAMSGKLIRKVNINLSPKSIESDGFEKKVMEMLEMDKRIPKVIAFEITEISPIQDFDRVNRFISKVNGMGSGVCIDDYGSGNANINYLTNLNANGLKIDMSIVQEAVVDDAKLKDLKDIVLMAKKKQMYVVAEYIESEIHVRKMQSIGVHMGQGFVFSRPKPSQTKILDHDFEINPQKTTKIPVMSAMNDNTSITPSPLSMIRNPDNIKKFQPRSSKTSDFNP